MERLELAVLGIFPWLRRISGWYVHTPDDFRLDPPGVDALFRPARCTDSAGIATSRFDYAKSCQIIVHTSPILSTRFPFLLRTPKSHVVMSANRQPVDLALDGIVAS
jgi:hypothetical protein